jgi:hypothetical protein
MICQQNRSIFIKLGMSITAWHSLKPLYQKH